MIGLLGSLELRRECLRKGWVSGCVLLGFVSLYITVSNWAVTGMFCSWGFLFGVHINLLFLLAQDLTSCQYHNEKRYVSSAAAHQNI
jgi:hypothetical protein